MAFLTLIKCVIQPAYFAPLPLQIVGVIPHNPLSIFPTTQMLPFTVL